MDEQQIEAMIRLARESLGVPFTRYGRDLKKGLSCIGLITMAAKAQGVECPTFNNASFVPFIPGNRPASDGIAKDLQRINTSEARTGDVLLFHIWSPWSAFIEHTALITGERPLTIIHATPVPVPEVIEHRPDAPLVEGLPTPWSFFVAGAYRFRRTMKEFACSCQACVFACTVNPCWPTMADAARLCLAGHARSLMILRHENVVLLCPASNGFAGKAAPNPKGMAGFPLLASRGRCSFLNNDDKCALHDAGLKPLEGRVTGHFVQPGIEEFYDRVIAGSWATPEGKELCNLWIDAMIEGRDLPETVQARQRIECLAQANDRRMKEKGYTQRVS